MEGTPGAGCANLANTASDYLRWTVTKNFSAEVKTVVGNALSGMFHSDPGTRASAPSVSGTDSPKMRSEGAIETLPEEGPSYPDVRRTARGNSVCSPQEDGGMVNAVPPSTPGITTRTSLVAREFRQEVVALHLRQALAQLGRQPTFPRYGRGATVSRRYHTGCVPLGTSFSLPLPFSEATQMQNPSGPHASP